MAIANKPTAKPVDPRFSAGPTKKRPGWTLDALSDAALGRSHRSALGKAKLKEVIDLTREVLEVPADYRIAIVPASDTGAVEMAMWSLLGPRGVDVAAWENFGNAWITDAQLLPLDDLRILKADYGQLPPLHQYTGDRDIVFTWLFCVSYPSRHGPILLASSTTLQGVYRSRATSVLYWSFLVNAWKTNNAKAKTPTLKTMSPGTLIQTKASIMGECINSAERAYA